MTNKEIYLPDLIGQGYKKFWNFKGRYRIVKGSRASKKSKTTSLWYIYNLMKYPGSNLLVIRQTYRTLKDSCFADLQWAAERLGVGHLWDFKLSPLEAIYRPTGQKILFRGLDDPLKITSITVPTGVLCWAWIEEAYEVRNEEFFNKLDASIRGEVPAGLFKQWTITLNPWSSKHWIKARFFDRESDPDILAMTTTYHCNEWLDDSDRKLFEDMRIHNPKNYQVAGLGDWGIVDGLVYERVETRTFALSNLRDLPIVLGLDFGYVNDPSALVVAFIDEDSKTIYIWDELYQRGMTNQELARKIREMGYGKERIIADSAEPKSIAELRQEGLSRVRASVKGPDSVLNGIQYLQNFQIVVHPRCTNFLTEIETYAWEYGKDGQPINRPVDFNNHLMDALRYACQDFIRKPTGLNTGFKGGL